VSFLQSRPGPPPSEGSGALGVGGCATFVVEQPGFTVESPSIPGQRAVSADNAVARHDYADRVGPDREACRAHRGWATDSVGELTVAARLARWNFAQCSPNFALERRAARLDGEVIYGVDVAREERGQFVEYRTLTVTFDEGDRALAIDAVNQLTHAHLVVLPVENP
jgi:hypothetical protein